MPLKKEIRNIYHRRDYLKVDRNSGHVSNLKCALTQRELGRWSEDQLTVREFHGNFWEVSDATNKNLLQIIVQVTY